MRSGSWRAPPCSEFAVPPRTGPALRAVLLLEHRRTAHGADGVVLAVLHSRSHPGVIGPGEQQIGDVLAFADEHAHVRVEEGEPLSGRDARHGMARRFPEL